MTVHAAVAERTLTLALVEQSTWNLLKRPLVLLYEIVFVGAYSMEVRRDNQIAGLTANGTRAVVMLGRSFVVSGTP